MFVTAKRSLTTNSARNKWIILILLDLLLPHFPLPVGFVSMRVLCRGSASFLNYGKFIFALALAHDISHSSQQFRIWCTWNDYGSNCVIFCSRIFLFQLFLNPSPNLFMVGRPVERNFSIVSTHQLFIIAF